MAAKIADGAVLTAHYAAGSVDSAALADDSVREDGGHYLYLAQTFNEMLKSLAQLRRK